MRRILQSLVALRRARSGAIAATVAITIPAMIGGSALAIDGALLYIQQNRLQVAADAAALAAAQKLPDSATARTIAIGIADANIPVTASGAHVLVGADVVTGNWITQTKTFVASGSPVNAVRTTTRNSTANGNAARFYLGRIFNRSTINLAATSTALSLSSCSTTPTAFQQGTVLPTTTKVITQGVFDGKPGEPASYQETPDHHPIVRLDNSYAGLSNVVLNATGLGRFTITVPGQGQFFVVVSGITNSVPRGALTTVFTVFSSPGPKSGGTATWVNNIRTANSIIGTAYCPVTLQSAGGAKLLS